MSQYEQMTKQELIAELEGMKEKEEDASRQSLSLLTSVIESPDKVIIFALDTNYDYLTFNEAHVREMKRVYGADIEVGCNILSYMLREDDRQQAVANYERVLQSGRFVEIQEYGLSGTRFWYELIFNPLRDDSDDVVGFTVFLTDITDRKQVEEDLKLSAERFERWKASNFIGILQSNSKGDVVDANDTLLTMLGYSRQELVDGELDWTQLTPPEFLPLDQKAMEEAAQAGTWRPFEKEYFHKDGHRVPILIGGSIFREDPDEYIVFVIDLTDRKQAGDALRLQAAIMSGVAEGVYLIGLDDLIIRWTNERFAKMFGYEPGELVGQRVDIVNAPTDLTPAETRAAIVDLLEETGEWHGEVNNIKRDGTHFWCYANVSLFDHPEYGKIMVSVHTDITDRKRAEKELFAYRHIVQSSNDMLALLDLKYTYLAANPAYVRAFGKTVDEIVGQSVKDVFGDEFFEEVIRPNAERCLAGETVHYQDWFEFPASGPAHMDITYSPYRDPDSEILGFAVVGHDMTDRKRAEEEALDSRDRLRKLTTQLDEVRDEERTALARELHDEVGQAMTAMRMDLDLIEGELPKGQETLSDRIHSIIDLTDDALERVNRLSHDLRSPVLEMLGLEAAVEAEVEEYQARWETEVRLEMEVGALEALGERDSTLYRILKESLTNVRRHARASRIEVSLRVSGEDLVLEVLDDGIGIVGDEFQGQRSFGLIGMRERAERLGGRVEIRRRDEGGTALVASIPLEPANG